MVGCFFCVEMTSVYVAFVSIEVFLLFSFLLLEVAKWVMLGTNVIPLLRGYSYSSKFSVKPASKS